MLAEPRRREKYSVNPRGLDWTNDDNKIGQKLMEKMGWKKGNSLGLRENGISQPISVMAKSNRQGVGCTKKDANNWIAHQDAFSSILASLNEDTSQPNSDNSNSSNFFSLEEKSKVSRSRVHYKKFAKGKDLSTYEAADIHSIFGQRQKQESAEMIENPLQETESVPADSATSSFGVVTINSSTSIQNYFAQKMADRKQRLTNGSDGCLNNELFSAETSADDNLTSRKHCKRKRTCDDVDSTEINHTDNDDVQVKKRKKSKKTKNSDVVETEVFDTRENVSCPDEQHESCDSARGKKRKKNKDKRDGQSGITENPDASTAALNNGDDGLQMDLHSVDVTRKKRKNKRIKTLDKDVGDADTDLCHSAVTENVSEVVQNAGGDLDACDGKVRKSKKSKKKKDASEVC